MELATKNTTKTALMNKRLRRITELAYENTLTIDVHDGQSDTPEMLDAAQPADLDAQRYRTLTGLAASPFADYANVVYRRNLIVKQGSHILLQRFAYPAHRLIYEQRRSVQQGYELLQAVYAIAKSNNSNVNRVADVPIYSFGVWHERGKTKPVVTADTDQNTGRIGRERRKAVEAFIKWFHAYADAYLKPLLEPRFNMTPAIRQSYHARAAIYDWLIKELPTAEGLAHPMFATMSTFSTFSTGQHTDASDLPYSFMVNFGGSCYLNLPSVGVRIHLQPLDVVFFRSKDLTHSTSPTPTTPTEKAPRWGVSGYVRSAFARSANVAV